MVNGEYDKDLSRKFGRVFARERRRRSRMSIGEMKNISYVNLGEDLIELLVESIELLIIHIEEIEIAIQEFMVNFLINMNNRFKTIDS